MSHEADDRKYGKASKNTGATVEQWNDLGIPENSRTDFEKLSKTLQSWETVVSLHGLWFGLIFQTD